MNGVIKLALYAVLSVVAAVLGYAFLMDYRSLSDQSAQDRLDLIERAADPSATSNPARGRFKASNAPPKSVGTNPLDTSLAATNPPSSLTNHTPTNLALALNVTNSAPGSNAQVAAADGTNRTAAGTNDLATNAVRAKRKLAPVSLEASNGARRSYSRMMAYGFGLFLVVASLALLLAHDVSHLFAHKAVNLIFDDDGVAEKSPEYDHAEQVWANGEYLEAIQLMRDYLKEHPREIYVAFRIAEIYETNLQNWLAAVLEYEEILKHRLPMDRWGWAAIHLANLYSGRMGKPDKSLEWLRRVAAECEETSSARKARDRLAQLEPSPAPVAVEPPPEEVVTPEPIPEPPRPAHNLPRGFRPKNS